MPITNPDVFTAEQLRTIEQQYSSNAQARQFYQNNNFSVQLIDTQHPGYPGDLQLMIMRLSGDEAQKKDRFLYQVIDASGRMLSNPMQAEGFIIGLGDVQTLTNASLGEAHRRSEQQLRDQASLTASNVQEGLKKWLDDYRDIAKDMAHSNDPSALNPQRLLDADQALARATKASGFDDLPPDTTSISYKRLAKHILFTMDSQESGFPDMQEYYGRAPVVKDLNAGFVKHLLDDDKLARASITIPESIATESGLITEVLVTQNRDGFVLTDYHNEDESYRFLGEHMQQLKKEGVDTIYVENRDHHFYEDLTIRDLEKMVAESKGINAKEKQRLYQAQLYLEARKAGIDIVPLENSRGASVELGAAFMSQRIAATNYTWSKTIDNDRQASGKKGKYIVFGGEGHFTHFHDPANNNQLEMGMVDENRGLVSFGFMPSDNGSTSIRATGNPNDVDIRIASPNVTQTPAPIHPDKDLIKNMRAAAIEGTSAAAEITFDEVAPPTIRADDTQTNPTLKQRDR